MSEITQEIDRPSFNGQVRVTIEQPHGRVTDNDWELMGKLAAAVAEHDAEARRPVGFSKGTKDDT